MKRSLWLFLMYALVSIVAVQHLSAQATASRPISFNSLAKDVSLAKRPDRTSALIGSPFGPSNTIDLPFDIDGAVHLGQGPHRVIVCGGVAASGAGVVAFVDRAEDRRYDVASTHSFAGRCLVGVLYAASLGKLVVLDATQGQLLWADYAGAGPVPTNWAQIPASNGLAFLAGAANLGLGLGDEAASSATLVLAQADGWFVHRVEVAAQGVVNHTSVAAPPILSSPHLRPGDVAIAVEAPSGTSVELVRLDGASPVVVGSGVVGTAGTQSIPFSVPPAFGWMLGVRRLGETATRGPYLSPIGRVGGCEAIDAATSIRPLAQEIGLTMYRGHSCFEVPLFLDHGVGAIPSLSNYVAYLGVGDPSQITTVDGRHFLRTNSWIPATARVWSTSASGYAPGKIPLDDDPALVGLAFSFQWLVFVGEGVALSDIVTTKVLDRVMPPPGMEGFFGRSTTMQSSSLGSGAMLVGPGTSGITPRQALLLNAGAVTFSPAMLDGLALRLERGVPSPR